MERQQWSFQGKDKWGWAEGELTVTAAPKHVHFSIEEEQAVDSYNQVFTCSCDVPFDQLPKLIELLTEAVRKGSTID